MGPWSHGQWSSRDGTRMGNIQFGSNTALWYQNNIEIPFFNYYLKGKGDDPNIAEATIFFSGANEWKKLNQWPPAETNSKPIYLEANGVLSWTKPGSKKVLQNTLAIRPTRFRIQKMFILTGQRHI